MPQDAGYPDPTPNPHKPRPDGPPVAGRVDPIALYDDPTPPPALTASPDLGALLRSLRHRWMAAVAFGLPLAALAAAAAWYLLSPKYTGFAQFRVLAWPTSVLGNKDQRSDFGTYMKTQGALLKGRPVVQQALKSDGVKRLGLEGKVADPAQYVEKELITEFTDQAEVLTLLYSASDPVEAVEVVKAVSAAYMDLIVYAESRDRAKALSDLEKVYGETGDSLRRKRSDLKKLADQLGTTDKETLSQQQMQLLESLRDARNALNLITSKLFDAQAMREAHRTRIEAMKNAPLPSGPDVESLLDTDAEYKLLSDRLKRVQEVVDSFGESSREPTYKRAVQVVAELKKKMETRKTEVAEKLKRRTEKRDLSELDLALRQYENLVGQLTTERDRLEKDVNELKAKVVQIGTSTTDLEALRADVKREEQLVNDIGNQVERLRLEVKSNPPRVTLFQEADLQKKDAKKQILAAVAAPVGVLFAVCMGLAWSEYKQRRVRCAGDVADGLGIRVVGAVPALRHAERHLVGANGEADVSAYPVLESFDAIRTQLLHDARSGSTRVVQVTSAAAGEGKTTLACHLATSLARAGRKTLLIDGDLRRPAVHQLFELPLQPGFSEVLLGEVEVAEGVQQTTLAGLSVMSAGQWDREVLQALARDGLEGIFEKLQEEFDFIVMDSHPVLPAADALLLARQADAVILSVLREVSQTPRVYAASRRLEAVGARVLGAVVNAAPSDEAYANPALAHSAA
jgi:capsular exopolysaccharide synthesis family protein